MGISQCKQVYIVAGLLIEISLFRVLLLGQQIKMYLWPTSMVEYQGSSQPPILSSAKSLIAAHVSLKDLVDEESQLEDPRERFWKHAAN